MWSRFVVSNIQRSTAFAEPKARDRHIFECLFSFRLHRVHSKDTVYCCRCCTFGRLCICLCCVYRWAMQNGRTDWDAVCGWQTHVGTKKHVLDDGAYWRHLGNTSELSVHEGDATLCKITLTTFSRTDPKHFLCCLSRYILKLLPSFFQLQERSYYPISP